LGSVCCILVVLCSSSSSSVLRSVLQNKQYIYIYICIYIYRERESAAKKTLFASFAVDSFGRTCLLCFEENRASGKPDPYCRRNLVQTSCPRPLGIQRRGVQW
jgi:hypothetical protein